MENSSPRKPTWCLFFKEIRHSLWRGGATALAFCRGEDVFFFDFWHTARLTNFQTSSLLLLRESESFQKDLPYWTTTRQPYLKSSEKKANSGMLTKSLYLFGSISVEIRPRNSGFKIAHWRGDLVPKRCLKRIIAVHWCLCIGYYNQFWYIVIVSYSLRIPFVYNKYIYNTGDVRYYSYIFWDYPRFERSYYALRKLCWKFFPLSFNVTFHWISN